MENNQDNKDLKVNFTDNLDKDENEDNTSDIEHNFLKEEIVIDKESENKNSKGIFELIYGVLFEPVNTFREVALNPPLKKILWIFILISIFNILSSVLLYIKGEGSYLSQFTGQALGGLIPLIIVLGLIGLFLKWVIYSGFLHILAELWGGKGKGIGVLAITALTSIPGLFFIFLELLVFVVAKEWVYLSISYFLGILSLIWGVILLVLGIKEVHQISIARALALVLTFPIAIGIFMIMAIILAWGIFAPLLYL